MPTFEKYKFLKLGSVVEVRAEALVDRYLHKGGDGGSELHGYEGSWRRATVVGHTKKEKKDKRRWVIVQLADPKAMYKKWTPLGRQEDPPMPINGSETGDDAEEEQEEEDDEDDDSDCEPAEFKIAPVDLRPWIPFSDTSLWPQADIKQLRVGVAVLYVDGRDECARWSCWIRRVFEDGVWLWVKGPEPGMPPWALDNHHVSCCLRTSPSWKATFGKDRPIFPMEDHLRQERAYNLATGEWSVIEDRAYFDPVWAGRGRINGNCPAGKLARQLTPAEADTQRMRAATAAVSTAITDGDLPEELQQFVRSFDLEACITEPATEAERAVRAEMLREPHFHDTFCGFLLDALRQQSAVGQAGVAVFEQIKVTFKQDALALQRHMAQEYDKACLR